MKLISSSHDYYDQVAAFGQSDPAYIFKRKEEEVELSGTEAMGVFEALFDEERKLSILNRDYRDISQRRRISIGYVHFGFLYFCGKIYPYLTLDSSILFDCESSKHKEIFLSYSEKISGVPQKYGMTFYDELSAKKRLKMLVDTGVFKACGIHDALVQHIYKKVETLFGCAESISLANIEHLKKFSLDNNCPYYVVKNININILSQEVSVVKNPILKHMQFNKVLDAATAHQEISMYVCGVLGNPEKDVVQISDHDMRDSKGFDNKSFKHRESKKKRKAKKG